MAGEVADLYAVLRLVTAPFSAGLRTAASEGESFTAKLGGVGGALNMLGAATARAGIGVATVSIKMAGDFQASMQKLVTTAGESQSNLKKVSDGILDVAVQTGTSTKSLADGMYMVESAGFHGAQGLTVLKAAAEGARAEQAPLPEVTNAVTSALKSYHLPASAAVQITNQMVAAVGHGKMTFGEFAGSLSTVLPIAASAHLGFDQVGGAIATLTNHGTSAREATQELAFSIRALQAPNNVAVQEMQRLGLSSVDVSTHLGQRGLTGTIQLLEQAVLQHMGPAGTVLLDAFNRSKQAAADAQAMIDRMPPSLQKLAQAYANGGISVADWRAKLKELPADQANLLAQFATLENKTKGFNSQLKNGGPAAQTFNDAMKKMMGGATGLNTALMLGGGNMASFKENVAAVGAAGQHAGKDIQGWAETQKTFNFQMSQLRERAEVAAITLGTHLIPVVSAVIGFFTRFQGVTMALAGVIGVVLAAAVVKFATGAVVGAVTGLRDLGTAVLGAGRWILAFARSELVAAAAARAMAIAQAALNLVLDANPIVLIVLAIIALAAALIYAYTHFAWFRSAVQATFRAVAAAVSFVIDFVRTHWQLLLILLLGPIGLAVIGLVKHWNQIRSTVTAAVTFVVGFVRAHWQLLLILILGPIGLVLVGLIKYWNQIQAVVITAVTTVVGFVKSHWQLLVSLIGGPIGLAVVLVIHYWNQITAATQAAWTAIHGVITHAVQATVQTLQSLWRSASSWISSTWRTVLGAASSIWSSIRSTITNAINGARNAVSSAISSIGSLIRSVRGIVAGALAGAGSWLYAAGQNIIRGLINGIWSMIGAAGSAISSVVSEIKSYLPWSPAKKGPLSGSGSPEIGGRNIGTQLARGLRAAVPDVSVASGRLLGATALTGAAGLPGTGLSAAVAGTGGGTVVVHNHIHLTVQGSVLSERDLRDVVQEQMLRLGMRSSTSYTPYKR